MMDWVSFIAGVCVGVCAMIFIYSRRILELQDKIRCLQEQLWDAVIMSPDRYGP